MTEPTTCGAAGGAISAWVNVVECSSSLGRILVSRSPIHCGSPNLMYDNLLLHMLLTDFI